MAIDLSNWKYTGPNGAVLDGAAIPASTVINGLTRAFDHVFSNEAVSKVSTARKKNNGVVSDEEAESIVAEAVEKYIADMLAGTWGEKGSRAVRMPGENRYDVLYRRFLYEATRDKLAKDGIESGEAKDTFVNPDDGKEYAITLWAEAYENSSELGDVRKAEIGEKATRAHEKELADANARKTAKARESAAPKLSL